MASCFPTAVSTFPTAVSTHLSNSYNPDSQVIIIEDSGKLVSNPGSKFICSETTVSLSERVISREPPVDAFMESEEFILEESTSTNPLFHFDIDCHRIETQIQEITRLSNIDDCLSHIDTKLSSSDPASSISEKVKKFLIDIKETLKKIKESDVKFLANYKLVITAVVAKHHPIEMIRESYFNTLFLSDDSDPDEIGPLMLSMGYDKKTIKNILFAFFTDITVDMNEKIRNLEKLIHRISLPEEEIQELLDHYHLEMIPLSSKTKKVSFYSEKPQIPPEIRFKHYEDLDVVSRLELIPKKEEIIKSIIECLLDSSHKDHEEMMKALELVLNKSREEINLERQSPRYQYNCAAALLFKLTPRSNDDLDSDESHTLPVPFDYQQFHQTARPDKSILKRPSIHTDTKFIIVPKSASTYVTYRSEDKKREISRIIETCIRPILIDNTRYFFLCRAIGYRLIQEMAKVS